MKNVYLFVAFLSLLLSACSNQSHPAKQDTIAVKPPVIIPNQLPSKQFTCKEIAYQILTSSGRFKELTKNLYNAVVKNGGTSYGIDLEGSPNPTQDSAMDFSKTYDFALHETYTDREVVTARFTFNPTSKQLYEYDVAQDSLIPIGFDKQLLPQTGTGCK